MIEEGYRQEIVPENSIMLSMKSENYNSKKLLCCYDPDAYPAPESAGAGVF